jgi:hypothetical protein
MGKIHDVDAEGAALAMIEHHGPGALRRACMHARKMYEGGDEIGAAAWSMIAAAIADLVNEPRSGDVVN